LTALLIVSAAISKSQTLEDCQHLYSEGYWRKADSAYQRYISTLDEGSNDYYIALSYYGELLYYLDNRAMSDSLLGLSAKMISGIKSHKEYKRAAARYACMSGKLKIMRWGKMKDNFREFVRDIDFSVDGLELELEPEDNSAIDYVSLLLDGERNMNSGLTWVAKNKFVRADEYMILEHEPMSAEYVRMLLTWARFYFTTTNYAEMLNYCSKAMETLEQLNLTDGVYYADAVMYKAVALSQLGDHKNSLILHSSALDLYRNALGENSSRYANALYYQGQSLGIACEIDQMIESELTAADIYHNTIGDNTPEYAAILNEIGVAYSMMGDTVNEFEYYKKSLEINKKFIGEGSFQTARQYYNISLAYSRRGMWDTALEYVRKANRIAMSTTGMKSVFTADCLAQRGYLNMMLGKYGVARKLMQGAMSIYQNALDPECLKIARAQSVIGNCDFYQGKYDKASYMLVESVLKYQQNLVDNFSFMTSQMRNLYWENSSEYFSNITKMCWKAPDDVSAMVTAYNCELISKGIELTSEVEFANIISNSNDERLRQNFYRLQDMRQLINAEIESPKDGRSLNIDSLKRAAKALEQQLIADSKDYGDLTKPIKVTFSDIRNILKAGEVAVEFVKCLTSDSTTTYGALMARSGWNSPKFVSLFTQRQFDDMYGSRIKPYTNTQLYEMVWKPMEQYLDDSCTIYFAPTGLLYNTAIEYAPIDDSLTISDKYRIFRISSTRSLVLDKKVPTSNNIVVYGGIYYDTDTTTMRRESDAYNMRRNLSDGFLRTYFARSGGLGAGYLPGTEKESAEIAATLSGYSYNTSLYTKDKANEESFKSLSGSDIRIIHIATHGFYLDDVSRRLSGDNNLLLSGLLMSGCNNIMTVPNGIEDGILTAREISYLDFRRTDMVVLSACETALGKVTDEGVYGLQRGFKKAGVNTIIMSLWPVNDYATKILMTSFYRGIGEGKNKRDAFLAAQRELRSKKGVNPSHWAAFIMLDGE